MRDMRSLGTYTGQRDGGIVFLGSFGSRKKLGDSKVVIVAADLLCESVSEASVELMHKPGFMKEEYSTRRVFWFHATFPETLQELALLGYAGRDDRQDRPRFFRVHECGRVEEHEECTLIFREV